MQSGRAFVSACFILLLFNALQKGAKTQSVLENLQSEIYDVVSVYDQIIRLHKLRKVRPAV